MRCLGENGPMTPKDIGEITNLKSGSVSKYIGQLKDRGMVYQTNPPARRGKLYTLNDWQTNHEILDK